jgi:subtilisin family serine protease
VLEEDLVGVCPDLRLYDLRVLDGAGRGDEFTVMAALQFVRYLNSTNDYIAVHGANLSLSIPHDISNYACGRTPVCDECERLVSSGVVVVAAAGNQGYRKYTTAEGVTAEAYNSISITDPGNADLVITVGATHRFRPHTYGVSYFSSRGPTGDGRIKPDLVAPGEKITAPLPEGSFGLKDGTSMAAPHVSGAAALLMARHNELVGHPARVKQILCATATDLGRERYFQGAGMLDVLRALQSV